MFNHRESRRFLVMGAAALTGTLLLIPQPAQASSALTLSSTSMSANVINGTSVTATTSLTASTAVTASYVSVCVRSASGANKDFVGQTEVALSTEPTTVSVSADFTPGTYWYFTCVDLNGQWQSVGATETFVASVPTAAPPTTATPLTSANPPSTAAPPTANAAAPSGVAMPVGNLPGWKQTFSDDFTAPLTQGEFPGSYSSKWMSYNGFPDTSHVGDYDQSIISVQRGTLDLFLHTVNGRPKGAAPIPLVNGGWGGQTFGRFSVRMRVDNLPGYGAGFLLWPDSNDWNDGEIDFPEGGFDSVVHGYNHCPGNPSVNCYVADSSATFTDWHTYTIDWLPTELSYEIDDKVIGSTTTNIPTVPMHWVMQAATTGVQPASGTAGHVLIDWATIYSYAP